MYFILDIKLFNLLDHENFFFIVFIIIIINNHS